MSLSFTDYLMEYDIRIVISADGKEMCYVTKKGENMCFEMSMCEFERWLFYRYNIHIRPKMINGMVGFLIRDYTPAETLISYVKEFLCESKDAIAEIA